MGTETSIAQPRKGAKSGLVDCRFLITVLNRERQKFKASLGYKRPPEVECWERMRVRNAYGSLEGVGRNLGVRPTGRSLHTHPFFSSLNSFPVFPLGLALDSCWL